MGRPPTGGGGISPGQSAAVNAGAGISPNNPNHPAQAKPMDQLAGAMIFDAQPLIFLSFP